jgi:hypothetical protein
LKGATRIQDCVILKTRESVVVDLETTVPISYIKCDFVGSEGEIPSGRGCSSLTLSEKQKNGFPHLCEMAHRGAVNFAVESKDETKGGTSAPFVQHPITAPQRTVSCTSDFDISISIINSLLPGWGPHALQYRRINEKRGIGGR